MLRSDARWMVEFTEADFPVVPLSKDAVLPTAATFVRVAWPVPARLMFVSYEPLITRNEEVAPAAITGVVQVSLLPATGAQLQPEPETLVKLNPDGNVSVIVTLAAVLKLNALLACKVYVRLVPNDTGSTEGEPCDMDNCTLRLMSVLVGTEIGEASTDAVEVRSAVRATLPVPTE